MSAASAVATPAEVSPYSLGPALATGVVFVHVPKTGGTSVARALYGTDGVGHRTARDLRGAVGADVWDRAFTFAVVREPVDRLASAFRYLRAGGSNGLDAAFAERELAPFDTLDSFVLGWLTARSSQSWVHFRPQADFVCGPSGEVLVDVVARYERLAADYEAVRQRTGVGGPLPWANAGPPRPAPDLSPAARARVAEVYAADFDRFDYPRP